MKEWLAEKKNQPIIIGVASLVIVVMVVFLLFQMGVLGGSATPPPPPPQSANLGMPGDGNGSAPPGAPGAVPPGAPAGSVPPGAPGGASPMTPGIAATPGAPGAPAGAAAKTASTKSGKKVEVASLPRGNKDPFMPVINRKKIAPPRTNIQSIVPTGIYSSVSPLPAVAQAPNAPPPTPAAPVQLGTISGIMVGDGVRAIYEANGQATVIQPGDELPDGNGRVASIQENSVTVTTTNNQTVNIPVTAGTVGTTDQDQNGDNGAPPNGPPPAAVPPGI